MPPLAMLVPGILWIFEHIVSPIAAEHLPTLTSKLGALASGSSTSTIISTIEGVVGKVQSEKLAQLNAELQEMLAQNTLNTTEANSASLFIAGWRPALCWGLVVNLLIHLSLINGIDVMNSLFNLHIQMIGPMDSITLSLLSTLLGIGIAGRTVEKLKDVQRDSMDD